MTDADITVAEVRKVLQKLKRGKAAGLDGVPAAALRALLVSAECIGRLAALFNKCWHSRQTPQEWHESVVTAIFKKGAPEICANYWPISLLIVCYKIYASILLRRLQEAGAEARLTSTQYGFRREFGTTDAIFCTWRLVELARAQ